MSSDPDYLIIAENVHFSWSDKPLISTLNLKVRRGDFITISGSNGAGKTTILKLLIGLIKPSSGRIIRNTASGYFGYIPQGSIHTDLPFTALEIMKLNHENITPPVSLLRKFSLEGLENRLYRNLSGGEKQKVNIVRCLMQNPEIIFLDEPDTYLDTDSANELVSIMEILNSEGTALIMAAHSSKFRDSNGSCEKMNYMLDNKTLVRMR